MENKNKSVKELEVGKDYVNVYDNSVIVIDRTEGITSRGFEGGEYKNYMSCWNTSNWREATEQEVIEAFKKHLVHRYGEDWKTMKIKERHPSLSSSSIVINNDGSWFVDISKFTDGWSVWNRHGLLYRNGIWVERLEEEPKIHIKEAIEEKTVIHCETIEEADRILKMAIELGYTWKDGRDYRGAYHWSVGEGHTCYYIFTGMYGSIKYFDNSGYTIIPSTQIADFEPTKSSDWVLAPEETEEVDKKTIEKLPIDKVTTRNLDIALRNKSLAPHRCPVCNGSGLVPNGFYMQTSGHWSTTSTIPETCRSCGGTGIVWG